MPRGPNLGLHALWRVHVIRQLLSGLSVEQFCAKNSAPGRRSTGANTN